MCCKVSPTLQVVILFYNSFINSHCVMLMYAECGILWTLCHQTGPSQCLQYIILESNSLSPKKAVTMSPIYYADIEIILHIRQKPNITINQFIHTSLVLHVKVDKASALSGPIKKFECIQSGVGGFLNLWLRKYLPEVLNQLSAKNMERY